MGADRPSWFQAGETIYKGIEDDPFDQKNARLLMTVLTDRRPNKDPYWHCPPAETVPADFYRETIARLIVAKTDEERQRILAGAAPTLAGYDRFTPNITNPVLYDFTVGDMYRFNPDKIVRDPFGPYPASVYQCIEQTLARDEFAGGNGIDLGSGPGDTTRILARRCKQVTAFDLFPFWHEVARARAQEAGIENVDYRVADLGVGIPVADHSVDKVLSNGMTAFIPPENMPRLIGEIARVLKPGGSYFEPEMERNGHWRGEYERRIQFSAKTMAAYLIAEMVTAPHLVGGHYPHSSTDIEKKFRDVGFRVIEYGATEDMRLVGVSTIRFIAP